MSRSQATTHVVLFRIQLAVHCYDLFPSKHRNPDGTHHARKLHQYHLYYIGYLRVKENHEVSPLSPFSGGSLVRIDRLWYHLTTVELGRTPELCVYYFGRGTNESERNLTTEFSRKTGSGSGGAGGARCAERQRSTAKKAQHPVPAGGRPAGRYGRGLRQSACNDSQSGQACRRRFQLQAQLLPGIERRGGLCPEQGDDPQRPVLLQRRYQIEGRQDHGRTAPRERLHHLRHR